jgi:tellurite resistance protein
MLMLVASAVWAALIIGYGAKWLVASNEALAELEHPVQCCFVGLVGVSTSLIALAAIPYSSSVAETLFVAGALLTFAFALWRTASAMRA